MWYGVDNYNHMYHICAKGFLDSNFNEASLDKISIFHEFPQISHTHKNRYFKSILGKRLSNSFYPVNFMAGTCKKPTF